MEIPNLVSDQYEKSSMTGSVHIT